MITHGAPFFIHHAELQVPADASFALLERREDQGYLAVAGGRRIREPRSVPRPPPKINGHVLAPRVIGQGGANRERGLGNPRVIQGGPLPLFQAASSGPIGSSCITDFALRAGALRRRVPVRIWFHPP
jgi:hypothetical protein